MTKKAAAKGLVLAAAAAGLLGTTGVQAAVEAAVEQWHAELTELMNEMLEDYRDQ